MSQFELVIFDCDGVLVDSERITNRVFCSMLNELGLELDLDDMFEHFVGRSMSQCVELITKMLEGPLPDGFIDAYRARSGDALRSVQPVPGVVEALNQIHLPMCVASSGEHEKIRRTLGTTGLLPRFDQQIYSVVDVHNPKPAPDVFLLAAERNGVSPGSCAVVEDTPTGVAAGVAAGMHVFGFAANTPKHRLEEANAHCIFSDMRELPSLLNGASA